MDTEQNLELPSETDTKNKHMLELVVALVLCVAVYFISSRYDMLEGMVEYSEAHESWELDEFITVGLFAVLVVGVICFRRWLEIRAANRLLKTNQESLQQAMTEIKELRGIIPICAECKKIRDGEGYWHQVEAYIHDHSRAEFSHGICGDCIKKLYPEYEGAAFKEDASDQHSCPGHD